MIMMQRVDRFLMHDYVYMFGLFFFNVVRFSPQTPFISSPVDGMEPKKTHTYKH